jgi:3-oxoacyl-[acyl-carrier protein] reductase
MRNGALQDQVVIITGGSRGIGRQLVLGAAKQGARVVFCARHLEDAARSVQREAESYCGTGQVLAIRADISQEQDVKELFACALDAFDRVDVVVNNAAISRACALFHLPMQDWDDVINVNLTGVFLVSRQAVRTFLARNTGGKIISMGSITQYGAPFNSAYAASKGGLVGLTQSIADEYGQHGIYAYLVIGGYIKTEMIQDVPEPLLALLTQLCPQKRNGSADEIAAAVLHLAANRGLLLNGRSMHVSGGLIEAPAYTKA